MMMKNIASLNKLALVGSSKTAPRILIFSIAIGAKRNSYEVKNSKIWAPAFFKHND